MTINTVERPYILTFHKGGSYPLTAEEAQRLLNECPAVKATRNRVVMQSDPHQRVTLTPATLGGGPAFIITR